MTEISYILEKYHRKTEIQLKIKRTEKKNVQTKKTLVVKEYFAADICLINCCSTHQEVPNNFNNNLVLFLQGFNFGNMEQMY